MSGYCLKLACGLAAFCVLTGALRSAGASPEVSALGEPREISRASSASRDTPTMNLVITPRDVRTAGGELAVTTLRFDAWTLRTGFAGMLELESDGKADGFANVFPNGTGKILWRGSYAYFVMVSAPMLGQRLCRGCDVEAGLTYRHESQHYTGSNRGGIGENVSDQPYVGDAFITDAAIARRGRHVFGSARALVKAYLPGRSSYSVAGGLDVHARWLGLGRWQPFVSAYAERQSGTMLEAREFPSSYLVRGLVGIAINSRLGDVLVYGFGDVGNRKGVRILTEEATAGLGLRLALP